VKWIVQSALALGFLGYASLAGAQSHDPIPIEPVSGEQYPHAIFLEHAAEPAIAPDHPPLSDIPPMPMPQASDAQLRGRSSDEVSIHDADTGETLVLPLGVPSGLREARSNGPAYAGIGGSTSASGSAPGLEAFSNMVVAGGLSGWPRSGNVKLVMRFTSSIDSAVYTYVCSGSMADGGVVQTAGHCVYARDPDGNQIFAWADEIWVYPAWDGVNADTSNVFQHFGRARGTHYLAGSNWVNDGNWDADLGAIRIRRDSRPGLGLLTGWFGWSWGGDCASQQARTYYNFSYPAENCGGGLHTGRTMYYWDGSFDSCPGNQLRIDTTAGCLTALWGGMSGSGAYYISGDQRYVHAVASTSNRTTIGNYARFWEQWVTDRQTYIDTTRGTAVDFSPLRFRTGGSSTVVAGSPASGPFTVLVANATNNDPALRTITVRVYLSTNSTISATDTLLATWNYSIDFAPMQLRTLNVPAPIIPASASLGTRWMGVVLDAGSDAFPENNATIEWDTQKITVISSAIFKNGFE
jgi:hypothetical protein